MSTYEKGIDVSEHQGIIDWDKVKGQVDFVMIRVGWGKNHIDRQFVRNISECNRLGIPCGAYWFSYATDADEAKAEAEYCVAALQPYKIDYPVCFDFEYDSTRYARSCGVTVTMELVTSMAYAFLLEIEAAGYWAMNYGNPDYLSSFFSSDLTARFDLWLADWPNNVDPDNPPRSCGIWQWGGATYDGITGNVDSNVAYKPYVPAAASPTEGDSTATTDTTVAVTIPEWKATIADKAIANGIIDDPNWKNRLDEPAPVWMVLDVANTLKGVK